MFKDDYVSRVTNPDALLPDAYSSIPISPTATTTQNGDLLNYFSVVAAIIQRSFEWNKCACLQFL